MSLELWSAAGIIAAALLALLALGARLHSAGRAVSDTFAPDSQGRNHSERLAAAETDIRQTAEVLDGLRHVPAQLHDLAVVVAELNGRVNTLISLQKGRE